MLLRELRPPGNFQAIRCLQCMVVSNELPENLQAGNSQATRKQLVAYNTCTLTLKIVVKSLLFAIKY